MSADASGARPEPVPSTLTYAVILEDPVTDEDVAAIADAILHQRGYGDAPEDLYARAVAGATDERCTPKERDYLRRLVEVLDARRPWPTLPYTSILPTSVDPGRFTPVADLPLSTSEVEERLRRSFQAIPEHDGVLLLLGLDTGHTILLRAQGAPTETAVTVLVPEEEAVPAALAAFRERTGLPLSTT